ncbi:MAG: signal recognition particle-docking protein FtsY [Cyanobacteria bacterium P01_H01_bin.162]
MANFNWFSRSFDQASEAEPPDSQKADAAPTEEAAPSESSSQTMSPEEYLAWAKTAYQNIQKQQTAESTPPEPETPSVEEEGTEAESIQAEPAPDESPQAAESEGVTEAVAAASAPAAESQNEPPEIAAKDAPTTAPAESLAEASSDITDDTTAVAEPSPAIETETDDTPEMAAGPAWMQSTAERQARLERLQETAIAEPEPEPEPESQQSAAAEAPLLDINFDEAFLWSAEVLASQGRQAVDISLEEITWLNRLRQGLDKTRRGLVNQLKAIVGQGPLNEEAVFEVEALLLQADVGVAATDAIIESLQARLREEILPPDQAIAYLKKILKDMLDKPLGDSHNLEFVPDKGTFNIWLMTGVNGAGKTTTIGKLAHIAKKSGYTCLIGAADTFRAAAVEQVKAWGARSDVEVIANPGKNTDPAAVVFDAITAAQSRDCELLLVDTAGRLQNKKNLMEELSKIRRIIDKKAPDAQVESLLVLDATLGQNGLRQAEVFAEAANLSGVVLTKLDGTARGGVALAVVQQLGLPIRFIGAGEGIEDLRPFSSHEFVEALLSG